MIHDFPSTTGDMRSKFVSVDAFREKGNGPIREQKMCTADMKAVEAISSRIRAVDRTGAALGGP